MKNINIYLIYVILRSFFIVCYFIIKYNLVLFEGINLENKN